VPPYTTPHVLIVKQKLILPGLTLGNKVIEYLLQLNKGIEGIRLGFPEPTRQSNSVVLSRGETEKDSSVCCQKEKYVLNEVDSLIHDPWRQGFFNELIKQGGTVLRSAKQSFGTASRFK
jgi:hypothetical protein